MYELRETNHEHSLARPRRRGFAAAFCLTAALCAVGAAGCADDAEEESLIGFESELFPSSDVIWTSLSIPTCWVNPSTDLVQTARRAAVRDQIKATWEAFSLVRFTGGTATDWGTCAPTSKGIRILIASSRSTEPRVTALGRKMETTLETSGGQTFNMVLNLDPLVGGLFCPAGLNNDICIRGAAVHEFGHALGWAGEDSRPDTTFDCTRVSLGNVLVGFPDPLSVMTHCDSIPVILSPRFLGILSPGDQEGIQQFYGNPTSVGRRKDAVMWDSNTLFFMHGSKYTRFTPSLSRTADYYPSQIFNDWDGWPSTWSSGVDAMTEFSASKVYMFRDNQYLRFDKTTDRVDAGYPKTFPGGWGNWPAAWTSVDAAIKWRSNGKIYMFRGSEYIRLTGTVVDAGYPKPISSGWNIPWTTGFDYVVNYPNGFVYFFKGTQYFRYDPLTDVVTSPRNIVGAWPGVMF
jgi:hypothetical protein